MVTLFLPATAFLPFGVAKIQEATGSYGPALGGLAALSVSGAAVWLAVGEDVALSLG